MDNQNTQSQQQSVGQNSENESSGKKAKSASPEAYVIISLVSAILAVVFILIPSGAPASLLFIVLGILLFIVSLTKVGKSTKKNLVVSLLVANLIVLGIYGYFIYLYRQANSNLIERIASNQQRALNSSPIIAETSSPTTDSPANDLIMTDWQTFSTNNKLNLPSNIISAKPDLTLGSLSFNYPRDWHLYSVNDNRAITVEDFYKGNYIPGYVSLAKYYPEPKGNEWPENSAFIQIGIGVTNLSVAEFVQQGNLGDSSIDDKFVNEKYLNFGDTVKIYRNGVLPYMTLFKISPSTLFIITTEINTDDKSSKFYMETTMEIPKILSTFKFVK